MGRVIIKKKNQEKRPTQKIHLIIQCKHKKWNSFVYYYDYIWVSFVRCEDAYFEANERREDEQH